MEALRNNVLGMLSSKPKRHPASKQAKKSFMYACKYGDLSAAQHLYNTTDLIPHEIKDARKNSPLHHACKNGNLDVIRFLHETTEHPLSSRNDNDNTPLHLAAWNDRFEVVNYMVKSKANLDVRSWNGSAPLHMAAVTGYTAVVHCLVENGANLNCKADNGRRPIHSAARRGYTEIVKYFVEHGADIFGKDIEGLDALEVALLGNHDETVQYLRPVYREVAKRGLRNTGVISFLPTELTDLILSYTVADQPAPEWQTAPQTVVPNRNLFLPQTDTEEEADNASEGSYIDVTSDSDFYTDGSDVELEGNAMAILPVPNVVPMPNTDPLMH
eukprot:129318_1